MEVKGYLNKKGWDHKKARNEFCLKECPLCGDHKWHFYINADTGVWNCKKCFAKGNLYQLKKQLGDINDNESVRSISQVVGEKDSSKTLDVDKYMKLHNALLSNEKAMNYLMSERGLQEKTTKHFKLGIVKEEGIEWLTIPHFSNGELINIKYRSLPPAKKKFKREPEKPSVLFNEDCLNNGFTEIFITEGEIDAMSLHQNGFDNVVATTAGACSFPSEWFEKLEDIEQIYLCFDADEAGQKGAYMVADKLGFERCKNILLPKGQDLNDYLKNHTKEDFIKLGVKARKFKIPDVFSISDVFQRFEERRGNRDDKDGIVTEWPNVNKHIGSFKPGHLIILSAIAKTGKTSFALNVVHQNALLEKPCFIYCLEMPSEDLQVKLSQVHLNRHIEKLDQLSESERKSLSRLPIYYGEVFGSVDSEYVFEKIRNVVKRYSIELVVFDNLHYLVRETRYAAQEIGKVTKGFKMLAGELKVPIILIAQPRKTLEGQMPTMMDLKDSSAIGTDGDQIIILWREVIKSTPTNPEELDIAMKPQTIVRVDASRYGPGGQTVLYFDGARSKFKRISEYEKR